MSNLKTKLYSFHLVHMDHMYAVSSKSGLASCRELGDLTWNDLEMLYNSDCMNCYLALSLLLNS